MSRKFPAINSNKADIFDKKSGHFPAVIVITNWIYLMRHRAIFQLLAATNPVILRKILRRIPAVLVSTSRIFFDEMSGHF